ncbi:MAG: sugar phosphate isomerase/epimerase family protein [Terriglobales bacterium]
MKTTRRGFVQAFTVTAMSSAFAWDTPAKPVPIAFSTLGCPAWDFGKILDFASQNGFAAVELRGLEGKLDLPSHPVFAAQRIEETKRAIASHNLRIACVSSSTDVGEADPAARANGFEDARRFIDLASSLGAPYVRVFGKSSDSGHPTLPSGNLKKQVAAGLRELGEYAGLRKVTVLIESHDDFTSSAVLQEVLGRADSPHVGLLWDAFHTFASSNEAPEVTVAALRPWIRHTHLKDAVGAGPDRKYVLTGRGNIPVRHQIEVLHASGYQGYYCFEWEKVWHPELEDPEIAIADYARVVKGYFADLKSQ